jgi:hypothetical protein
MPGNQPALLQAGIGSENQSQSSKHTKIKTILFKNYLFLFFLLKTKQLLRERVRPAVLIRHCEPEV